jgi:hypothetical protein
MLAARPALNRGAHLWASCCKPVGARQAATGTEGAGLDIRARLCLDRPWRQRENRRRRGRGWQGNTGSDARATRHLGGSAGRGWQRRPSRQPLMDNSEPRAISLFSDLAGSVRSGRTARAEKRRAPLRPRRIDSSSGSAAGVPDQLDTLVRVVFARVRAGARSPAAARAVVGTVARMLSRGAAFRPVVRRVDGSHGNPWITELVSI